MYLYQIMVEGVGGGATVYNKVDSFISLCLKTNYEVK